MPPLCKRPARRPVKAKADRCIAQDICDEIASVLASDHNCYVKYQDKQPPHPALGVNIRRGLSEAKIKRLRELISIIAPHVLKPKPAKPTMHCICGHKQSTHAGGKGACNGFILTCDCKHFTVERKKK